jgi:D-alanyl-lipoteichoic acid acyltransferase DltB (MBOAT superfamily)
LIPQVLTPRTIRPNAFAEGTYLVLSGLFRKIVIADNMASLANAVFFSDPGTLSGPECLMGIYAFALQIYGDFSGYTDIARGISKWMGFELMENFRRPYFAQSPSDFWGRWHTSLSTWLRDYLYIPLGGNRGAAWKTYRNLLLTMLLGGIWHGANWTFVAWGLYHGLLLCLYRPFERRDAKEVVRARWIAVLRAIVMFHLVCFGWLLFRSNSVGQALAMAGRVVTDFHLTANARFGFEMMLFIAGPFLLYEWWIERRDDNLALVRVPWPVRGLAYAYFAVMLTIAPAEWSHAFIYFQF